MTRPKTNEMPLGWNIWLAPTDNDRNIRIEWEKAGFDSVFTQAYSTELCIDDGRVTINKSCCFGGTNPANAGGSWIAAVKGFAGISEENGQLICKPNLPEKLNGMRFKLMYKGKQYSVEIKGGL